MTATAKGSYTRPAKRINIDWDVINELLQCGSSQRDCASQMGIDPATLGKHCQIEFGIDWIDYARMWADKGCNSLRVTQHRKAIDDKDTKMLIWLGKQRLGQSDKIETDNVSTVIPAVKIYIPHNDRDVLAIEEPRVYLEDSQIISSTENGVTSLYSDSSESEQSD